jgi:hypothetical protein
VKSDERNTPPALLQDISPKIEREQESAKDYCRHFFPRFAPVEFGSTPTDKRNPGGDCYALGSGAVFLGSSK